MFYEGFRKEIDKAGFVQHLSPSSQATVARWAGMYREERAAVEAAFRAALARDGATFRRWLAVLHPGEVGRSSCLVHLCRMAQRLVQGGAADEYGDVFTSEEAASLVRRFAHVDRELRSKSGAQWSPGFQIKGPLDYELVDMPDGVGVGALVESWSESPVEARTPDGHSYR